jgi:hypothetical protein
MSSAEILSQRIPVQDLGRLSLVGHQPKKLTEWVAALPMINVGETSRQVFQTLQELNRLKLDFAARTELLEILRPVAHSLCDALSKHYLNQSVMLPERATKVATLAQAMQTHLATGYKIVALESLAKLGPGKRDPELARMAARAVHRAITELSGNLLRSTQLYLNTPPRLWLELHALYLCAADQGLEHEPKIEDTVVQRQTGTSSVEDVYKRALLLATCKPNKLRQSEVAQIFQLGEIWAPLVNLKEFGGSGELFVFDLSKDAPPTYRTQARADDAYHVRAIDPSLLVHRLNELKRDNQAQGPKGRGETALSLSLLQHLIQAWSELTERSFSRVAHDGKLEACLGLTATHYFLANGMDFDVMMRGEQGRYIQSQEHNPFIKRAPSHREDDRSGKDVWAMAFGNVESNLDPSRPVEFNIKAQELQQQAEGPPKYDIYTCQIVNISPGGYCIQWTGEPPSSVRAGEILGLREEGQTSWSIGVIRWVKQLPGQGAQLGIEVLAPKAKPCGARVIKKTGEATEYMRTLLLPELKAIGRPATLITPALTFRPGYKVGLNLDGEEVKAHLSQQLSATPSFCQFEFNLLRKTGLGLEDSQDLGSGGDEDFDAIWASL